MVPSRAAAHDRSFGTWATASAALLALAGAGRHRCGSANWVTPEDRRTERTKGKEAAMKAHSTKRIGVLLTAVALSALSVPLAMLLATPAWPDGPRARPECTITARRGTIGCVGRTATT
jgi:hypothetical protein